MGQGLRQAFSLVCGVDLLTSAAPWDETAEQIRAALAEGLEVWGIVDEAEVLAAVGASGVHLVIEATDLVGPEQADAFTVVCDRLATVREQRSVPAVGILLVAGRIDDEALALGLAQMSRQGRDETIVVPLTADQAQAVSSNGAHLFDLINEAVALIQAEASPHLGSTISHASKLRNELDELIERHCA